MTGYYNTPNTAIPLNDRQPGEIADIALTQLAQWQKIAHEWPLREDLDRDGREATICSQCYQVLWFMSDLFGQRYHYTPLELSALVVAHIRQNHPEAGSGKIP